ncbi:hypothetical protein CMO91_03225 [Candidatus Woesearchaeota archaeon]|nr:hypothetical protein [Candidatus Woesearchaeota archaeon]|tara:strand:- start:356 stop:745 length:390 start_codon:yes stop_codon:yes gene_type:complete
MWQYFAKDLGIIIVLSGVATLIFDRGLNLRVQGKVLLTVILAYAIANLVTFGLSFLGTQNVLVDLIFPAVHYGLLIVLPYEIGVHHFKWPRRVCLTLSLICVGGPWLVGLAQGLMASPPPEGVGVTVMA